VLDDSGIVRSDIRSSFGSSTTTAEGVPLEIRLTVRDAATGDAATGAGVYLWQCDRDGNYSLYSQAAANVNHLRGAQEADANGTVTFQSIFPACYSGRWPHIHFEVYETLSDATSSGPIVKTSQIALPKEACEAVYATSGYEQSVSTPVPGQPGRRHGLRRRRRHPPARHHVRRRLRRLHRHPDHRGLRPRPR
jgi:protocatechuate 3,4-dioxygenase beta subunit